MNKKERIITKIEDILRSTFGSIIIAPIFKELAVVIFNAIENDINMTEKGD